MPNFLQWWWDIFWLRCFVAAWIADLCVLVKVGWNFGDTIFRVSICLWCPISSVQSVQYTLCTGACCRICSRTGLGIDIDKLHKSGVVVVNCNATHICIQKTRVKPLIFCWNAMWSMFPIFFLSQVWVWTCMQWFVDYTSIQEGWALWQGIFHRSDFEVCIAAMPWCCHLI
jgi:hypothetical protein